MRKSSWGLAGGVVALLAMNAVALVGQSSGERVYRTSCLICHGEKGDGKGEALPFAKNRPRDFTSGKFKVRSTPPGTLPTDEDVFRTVTSGFPQYGMPSFKHLSAKERRAAVEYLKTFTRRSGRDQGRPVDVGPRPPATPESIARGKSLYEKYGCAACHGTEGKGDGPLPRYFPRTFEEDGAAAMPRDFTKGRAYMLSGGTPEDIVRTLVTGFDGTKMVPYAPALETPGDFSPLWDVAHYIDSLLDKAAPPPIDSARTVAAGKNLFRLNCASCHSIGAGKKIGPDLKGVTEKWTASWVKGFIQSPSAHFASNDAIAAALLNEYSVPMPDLGLKEDEVEAVIAYLADAGPRGEAEPPAPAQHAATLAASLVALSGLTLAGLKAGTKEVEVRP